MKIFETDINKLAVQLLLTFTRDARIRAFLDAFVAPLVTLKSKLNTFRQDVLYRLTITPQVCYLEKMLNDRYDNTFRRIYISDGVMRQLMYTYTQAENKPIYAYSQAENKPIYVFTRSETGYLNNVSFVVSIPQSIVLSENEVRVLVNRYKLIGKGFSIKRF